MAKTLCWPSEKALEIRRLHCERLKQLYVRAMGNTWFCYAWELIWQNFNFNCTLIPKTSCTKTSNRGVWHIYKNSWSGPNNIKRGGIVNSVNHPSLVTAPYFTRYLNFDPRSASMWRWRLRAIEGTKLRDTVRLRHPWLDSSLRQALKVKRGRGNGKD